MKIGNRKLIVVIMLLLTINIHAATLEQRLIDKSTQKEAIKELWDKGDTAVPELKEMLKSSNKEMREIAINRLGQLKAGKDGLLVQLEIEKEQGLRTLIVFSLMNINDISTIPIFQNRAQNKSLTDEDRMVAVIGLGNIGVVDSKTMEILKRAVDEDVSGHVRMRAAYFISKNSDKYGYKKIIEDMKSEDKRVREYALEAIGEISKLYAENSAELNALETKVEEALKDEAIWVQIRAKEIKRRLEFNKLGVSVAIGVRARKSKLTQTEQEEEKNKKIEYLKKVINEEDQYEVQIWASEEMLKFGEKGIEELKEIVNNNQKGARAAGKTMLRAGVK